MEGLAVLLVLLVLAVPILLVVALVKLAGLRQRVDALEAAVAQQPFAPSALAAAVVDRAQTAAPPASMQAPVLVMRPLADVAATTQAAADVEPARASQTEEAPQLVPPLLPSPRQPAEPDAIERALQRVKGWFTTGNVPVKVGMLVLFAGVAALLKYAADQGWMTVPPAVKLTLVAAVAMGGLVFAWRKRESQRTFALSLQGGAIGVLLLVVFAAFKLFMLLPALAALAISIVMIAGAGALAVLQNAKALAVFALLAGFLAPIWLSTGSGNHVALFSYYAVLNVAIFGIAWFRSWRVLNLLGFAFTFGIGTVWGALDYAPEKYASTQPFLALFFAVYLAIPLLFARRMPVGRRDVIDGCLIFGVPLVAFSLQAGLLQGDRLPLAFCALGVGALYASLAAWLRRKPGYAVLMQAYALLAVGFATLAVPLALSAQATACVFALEGAGLIWLGLQRGRRLPQFSGAGLQVLAALAFVIAQTDTLVTGATAGEAMFANARFMSALLMALAGFASAWAYRSQQREGSTSLLYYVWALAWWVGAGIFELIDGLGRRDEPDALLGFAALTGWLAAEVHRRRPAGALASTSLLALASALPLSMWQAGVHQQPFAGYGLLAWLVYAVLGIRSLQCLRTGEHRSAPVAQFVWWLVWPWVASLAMTWWGEEVSGLGEGWQMLLTILPWLLLAAISLHRWSWLALPLGDRFDAWRGRLQGLYAIAIGLWWLVMLFFAGNASPLPWLPVLNPLELAQLAALGLLLHAQLRGGQQLSAQRISVLSGLAFVWISTVVLRAVHHWGGEPWGNGLLSTSLAQTSLSVTWSVLGVLGWVLGSRRGQRQLWLAGAMLMAVVLAKLVLVDRQHLGNLLGIGSFIAYGLLCTVVGYLAPAPPSRNSPEEAVVAVQTDGETA